MNCREVRTWLDLYEERELPEEEQRTVEAHLRTCPACRKRLANLEQVTTLLYQLPPEEPTPDLAARIVAVVEARAAQAPVRQPWLRTVAVGLGALFSALLLLALGYQTILGLQQGGAAQFISLLLSTPHLLARYPTESLYAVLESLPLFELALTLGTALVVLLLGEQFVGTLTSQVRPQLNGNHWRSAS